MSGDKRKMAENRKDGEMETKELRLWRVSTHLRDEYRMAKSEKDALRLVRHAYRKAGCAQRYLGGWSAARAEWDRPITDRPSALPKGESGDRPSALRGGESGDRPSTLPKGESGDRHSEPAEGRET